ncbi:FAD-binding monooxygenase [Rhodococcus sp. D2-41]|uniref:FAD-dependent oxidoreductase n=1 Tax=Speluncibacter jeojiensis TaxID=2710754 RepID=UPI002410B4FA|nr:FAD-dependent oxidoreductase [Rhodococcus sp. D2-41]MDG3010147.1 FAD-binding monooxygenase [Rhodococcus sp. D2-41]
MTDQRTILISGAGIAGPALAYWLEARGWSVTVVETAPGVRPGGQTVDLRGAGREVVERMGLMPTARELSMEQRGIAWVDESGRHRAEMPVDVFDGDGIVSEIEILRGDLAGLLHDATRDRVEYLFGTRITALDETPDAVTVTLSDGSVRTVDLVVGADGPHSTVRRMAFGPEEQFVRPVGGYTAWFTAPDHVGLDGWYEMHNAPGGLAVSMRPDSTPGGAKASFSFASEPLDYDRRDVDEQRRLIADRFAGVGWQAPALIDAAQLAEDFYFDAIVQVQMDRWSRGRIVLVGDAGYCPCPLTGMGTSLALVGAYVLAGELDRADGDLHRAFVRYEEVLRPYVERGQELPGGGMRMYAPKSGLWIRLGRLITRAMVSRVGRPLAKRAFFSHAYDIDLPEYPAAVRS